MRSRWTLPTCQEGGDLPVGGVPPADAERVAGRIGVHLVVLVTVQVRGGLQQPRTERATAGAPAWHSVIDAAGQWRIGVQLAPDHVPPDWPAGSPRTRVQRTER